MLSVNSMLNSDRPHPIITEKSTSSQQSMRSTVLNISHILCDPPLKSPSLSPSSSPSPTDSFPFPFAQELNTPTTQTTIPSPLHYANSDFALHSRPFLPTTLLEDKRRSPSLPIMCGQDINNNNNKTSSLFTSVSASASASIEEHDELEEDDELDDDQLSINSKTSSLSSSTSATARLKAKRRRANAKQLQILNQVFDRTFFPSTQMRAELGRQLGMSPRTVQIWFQNKRQAMRTRERQRLLKMKDGSD
ncbi:unnamed protein product [Absidia cylindrospora]